MGFAKKMFTPQGIRDQLTYSGIDHRWIGKAILGKKVASQVDLGGQLMGDYNSLYKPANVPAIPATGTDTAALVERDRMRRLAKQANGIDSTIRTSPAGATLYSPQPKTLLGS